MKNILNKKVILAWAIFFSAFTSQHILASSFNSNGFQISFNTNDAWETGCGASINITNNTGASVSNWVLDFDFSTTDQTLSGDVWNGVKDNAASTANHLRITNASWDFPIAAGKSISQPIGMMLNFNAKTIPGIKNVTCATTVSGLAANTSPTATTNAPVSTPTTPVITSLTEAPGAINFTSNGFQINFSTSGGWATGCQAAINITNNTGASVSNWILDFDFSTADQILSGDVWNSVKDTASTATHLRLRNASWDTPIGAGKSISQPIGMMLNFNAKTIPGIKNVTCTTTASIPSVPTITPTPTPVITPVTPTPVPVETPTNPVITPIVTPTTEPSAASNYKVIGYFPNWLIYPRNNTSDFPHQAQARPVFTPADIDVATSKLTHVYFAFAKPYTLNADPDALANMDPATDNFSNVSFNDAYWNSGIKNYKVSIVDPWCDTYIPMTYKGQTYNGHFAVLRAVKAANPGLKTMLSIGGWTIYNQGMPAAKYSTMIASAATRSDFITSAIAFTQKYGFDGIDIDYEYPTFNGGVPADTANYTIFLQEFRTALNIWNAAHPTKQLSLSLAAPAGLDKMQLIEVAKIHQYVDWINLMTYDFAGSPWSEVASHNAPLYKPTKGDGPNYYADFAVQYYLQQGVPANKLILGMPLYGRSFGQVPATSVLAGLPGIYNPYTGTGSSVTDDGPGYQSWPNIKSTLLDATSLVGINGYTRYWDDVAKVPYLYNATTQDLISYDDDQSLGVKAQYVKTNKLGGAMFWQLENDAAIWTSINRVQATLVGSSNSTSTPAPTPVPTPTSTATATAAIIAAATTAATAATSSMFTIKYETVNDWGNGYQGSITITNISNIDVFGWTLNFDFLSSEQVITSLWGGTSGATLTAGHVIITNPTNAKIGAGASIDIGIIVNKNNTSTSGIKNAVCTSTPNAVIAPAQTTPFVAPTNPTPITPGAYKVIGYFPNWLIYPRANNTAFPHQNADRPLFTPGDIDVMASKLTHVYFAFAKPYTLNGDPDSLASMDASQDKFCNVQFNDAYWNSGIKNYKVSIVDPWCDTCMPMNFAGNTYIGHFATLRAVKAKYPGLKTIVSIGGWTIYNQGMPAAKFSTMVETAATRKEFIDSAILFTQKYGFDGVDIDFEYPAHQGNGGKPADTQNYTLFLQEFRTALNSWNAAHPTKQLTLSIAAPAGITNMQNIEINKIHQYVDWINLMTYDFNGDWASTTGHNAPLTAPVYNGKYFGDGIDRSLPGPTFYADYAVQYYLKQGVPASKLILGMPLYGRSFANAAATETVPGYPGLYNAFDHTITGSQVTDDGHSYQSWPNIKNNILPNLATNGYKRYWDAQAQVPYLFNANYSNPSIPTAKTDFITYDDDQSLGVKATYVKTNKLGGAMFWQLENDAAIWSAIGNVGTILSK